MLKNQKGFAVVEAILAILLIAAIGAAGYFAYKAEHRTPTAQIKTTTTSGSSQPKTTANTPAPSDHDLIVAAVRQKGVANADGSTTPVSNVTVDSIEGDNAKGHVDLDPTGFSFIAHRANGAWTVIYEGQELPGSSVGRQYGLPSGWYSTDF